VHRDANRERVSTGSLSCRSAGYLFNQLVTYREARRRDKPMQYMVSHLSDG
jgi:cytochrome c553